MEKNFLSREIEKNNSLQFQQERKLETYHMNGYNSKQVALNSVVNAYMDELI